MIKHLKRSKNRIDIHFLYTTGLGLYVKPLFKKDNKNNIVRSKEEAIIKYIKRRNIELCNGIKDYQNEIMKCQLEIKKLKDKFKNIVDLYPEEFL